MNEDARRHMCAQSDADAKVYCYAMQLLQIIPEPSDSNLFLNAFYVVYLLLPYYIMPWFTFQLLGHIHSLGRRVGSECECEVSFCFLLNITCLVVFLFVCYALLLTALAVCL